jgi:hypothetical protein
MWEFSGKFSGFSVEDRASPSAIFEIPWKIRLFVTLEALAFRGLGKFDFIWLHPPYFQMVRYNPKDTRCLSTTRSVDGVWQRFATKWAIVFTDYSHRQLE